MKLHDIFNNVRKETENT